MSDAAPQAAAARTRPFYWSLRRELWEHRAVWLTPPAVAAFAALVHLGTTLVAGPAQRAAAMGHDHGGAAGGGGGLMGLYDAASGVTVIAALLVGALYCAGALHGERRDRSILFWKSLPVSDRTAVLAKAAVPMLVLPVVVFATVVVANLAMLTLQSAIWSLQGADPRALWAHLDLPFLWLGLLYGLPFMTLWYAPIYAWLLLASAWAQRLPLLIGLAPFGAWLIVEHTALAATPAHWGLERWIGGGVTQPYTTGGDGRSWITSLAGFEPARIWTLPQLWIGVLAAVGFIALAIRLRRVRGPL